MIGGLNEFGWRRHLDGNQGRVGSGMEDLNGSGVWMRIEVKKLVRMGSGVKMVLGLRWDLEESRVLID